MTDALAHINTVQTHHALAIAAALVVVLAIAWRTA